MLVSTAAQLAGPYLTRIAIDDYIAVGDTSGLLGILGLYAAMLGVGFLAAYGQAWIVNLFGQRVMRDIRRDVFDHIQKLHTGWFDRHPVGKVVTRATSDVDALNELLSSGVVMIITDVVLLVGITTALVVMNWQLALVTFGAVPALFISGWIFRRRIRPAFRAGAGGGGGGERLHPGDADRHGGPAAVPAGTAAGARVPEAEPGSTRPPTSTRCSASRSSTRWSNSSPQ